MARRLVVGGTVRRDIRVSWVEREVLSSLVCPLLSSVLYPCWLRFGWSLGSQGARNHLFVQRWGEGGEGALLEFWAASFRIDWLGTIIEWLGMESVFISVSLPFVALVCKWRSLPVGSVCGRQLGSYKKGVRGAIRTITGWRFLRESLMFSVFLLPMLLQKVITGGAA